MVEDPLIALAFLSLFHLVGGGVMGMALRGWRSRSVNWMLVVWALGFGGLPLLFAFAAPWLLPVQLLELAVAFCIAFFFWERVSELMGRPSILMTLFGGVFFVAGCAAAGLSLTQGQVGNALLFGTLFGGFGLALIILGLRRILRPPDGNDG